MIETVLIEWDGSSSEAERRRWVARRVQHDYKGEGFVFRRRNTDTVGGDWEATESMMLAECLVDWLNEREGKS